MAASPTLCLVSSEPRAPQLAIAFDAASHALARRLLELDDASLAGLECAAADAVLVVRAPEQQLPWVDGVRYLAALPGAPELYVPAQQAPNVHPQLAARALARVQRGPIAWLADAQGRYAILPLAALGPPSRARLRAYCEGTS